MLSGADNDTMPDFRLQAVRTPAEIPRAAVELKEILGSGRFGVVHRAIYKPVNVGFDVAVNMGIDVAVKTLRQTVKGELEAFLAEATITVQFKHCNVL